MPAFLSTLSLLLSFQVELKLSKPETYFERDLFFPKNVANKKEVGGAAQGQITNEFHFGAFIWTLAVKPQMLLTWRQVNAGNLVTSQTDGKNRIGCYTFVTTSNITKTFKGGARFSGEGGGGASIVM
jgi:hypothetical protein